MTDHSGHDHSGHHHSGHDHSGHGHSGHDHSEHSHRERPPGHRAAESGGAAIQLELSRVLPGETDELGRFEKLEEALRTHHGVLDAHIRRDVGHAELCVHFDTAQTTADAVIDLARTSGARAAKRYLAKTWFVRNMDCAQCATVIEHSLTRMEGVLTAHVAYASERLVLEFDRQLTSGAKVEARLEALGYALEEPQAGHACAHHAGSDGLAPTLALPLSIAGGVLTFIAWGLERAAPVSPTVTTTLYALAIASAGAFAARGTLQSLRQRRVDIESLMVIAALAAALLGAWFEGAFLLFLFSIGHAIEHRAMDRARRAVDALGALRPAVAQLRRGDQVIEVPVAQVMRGDRVVVRPGDRVPLDGVIRHGASSLDQSAITGESVPVAKQVGDEVFCGTINGGASLEVEVTRRSTESVLAKVVDLVVEAEARKSPAQRLAQKIEQRFVPIVLVLAVALPVVLVVLGLPLKVALLRAVALLVAASPCALAISTPAAVLSAVAAAARGGVLVKGGAALEALGVAKVMAFDKTGTLTHGRPKLLALRPTAGTDDDTLLALAASAEALSSHPLARAVVEAAALRKLPLAPASGLEAVHGKGLRVTVAGQPVSVGSAALFEAVPAELQRHVDALELAGQTTMIVHSGERFMGVLGVADTLRAEAKAMVEQLRGLGIVKTVMLSGDNTRVATAIGALVGIDEVQAPLLPEGKVQAVKALARGKHGVAMVGDGVNDAPALASASVGVAMGGASSDVALETADIVLMSEDLTRLTFAVDLARRTTRVVTQNLVVSIGIAGVLIIASVLGLARVSEAVVFHEGGTLLVIANGLRLLRFTRDNRATEAPAPTSKAANATSRPLA